MFKPYSRSTRSLLLAALTAAAIPACTSAPDTAGAVLHLTAESDSGAHYRLSNATFVFTGPEPVTVSTEQNPDGDSLIVELAPGSYDLELLPGWQ